MGRTKRPHLPGVPFHLTARIQGHGPLFNGLEQPTARIIREAADRSDGELMAFAVMSNHLHLLYVQGARPLSSFMQPLLTRLALLMRRTRDLEGHVFERRFRDTPCTSARRLRTAVAYIHLNPVRAGICSSPADYAWTTHGDVASVLEQNALGSCGRGSLCALRVFSPFPGASLDECRDNYRAYLSWRIRKDWHRISGAEARGDPPPTRPAMDGGDFFWEQRFGLAALHARERRCPSPPMPDLRDLVLQQLKERNPEMPLDVIRSGHHSRAIITVRDPIILHALELGYRGRAIARFFNVSPPTISRLKARLAA